MGFAGDKKAGKSLLWRPEERLKQWLLPLVPKSVETYHLTLTTVIWSLLIIAFSFLARYNRHWLWGSSVMIVCQYLTDLLDGAIGRKRDTGLVKWGYYMDHFLDYLFLCAILIGYSFLVEDYYKYILFFIMALFGGFMVNSFLSFAATNSFKISYLGIGPTEIRIVFIFVNTVLIFQRTTFVRTLPYILGFSTFGLFYTIYRSQQEIWRLDMKAKHGDLPEEEHPNVLELDWSLGLSARKVARNVVISMAMAGIAFALWMLAVFPYHRQVATAIYFLGWIPFVVSLVHRRAILRQRGKQLKGVIRPHLPHIVLAALLATVGYVAHVLVPIEDSELGRVPLGDLTENIQQDKAHLNVLRENIAAHFQWLEEEGLLGRPVLKMGPKDRDLVRESWYQLMTTTMEFDLMKGRYKGFYQVDNIANPEIHADCFFLAYRSLVYQLKSALEVVRLVGDNKRMENLLNEADPQRGIPKNSFLQMRERAAQPDDLLRFNAGALYLQLVKGNLTFKPALLTELEEDVKEVYRVIGNNPDLLVTNPLRILEEQAFSAWFPLQAEVALQMSLMRTTEREHFITREQILSYRDRLQPGDIVLERRNWVMSNVGIPGFWPHVALYIGTPEELDAFFKDLPSLDGKRASDVLREQYPRAFRIFMAPDGDGYDKALIEALQPGSIFTSLEASGTADYIGVVRPRVSVEEKFAAIQTAFTHHAKPYDYNFDFSTDNMLVCSELVHKCYEKAPGFTMKPTVVAGRFVIAPNAFAKKFALERGTDKQELDFILFLEGSETDGVAVERDEEAFSKTWQRPKWEVMQE